jgi:hypothetical protein
MILQSFYYYILWKYSSWNFYLFPNFDIFLLKIFHYVAAYLPIYEEISESNVNKSGNRLYIYAPKVE